jgi:hypothetical protein
MAFCKKILFSALVIGLKVEVLVDVDTIGGVEKIGDFPTNRGANAMLGIEPVKVDVCVDLRQGNSLLGRGRESDPKGGISCVRSED